MHKQANNDSRATAESRWQKIKSERGLYRYTPSGVYFARVRRGGRLTRQSLRTNDLATARRLLRDLKSRLDRTNPALGKVSFLTWLEDFYWPTLKGADSTLIGKRRIIDRVKETWLKARTAPMVDLRPSEVEAWLTREFGGWSSGYYNSACAVITSAFAAAVRDKALTESPAAGLKYRRRSKPVRLTPDFAEFQAIIADIRGQKFSPDAQQSADFLEFLGLAGLGQAEASNLTRAHVNFDSATVLVFRQKTRAGFAVPIYPQLRPLLEKLCAGKRPNQYLFHIADARAALRNACGRLQLPPFTQRSLRRMHITRCLERGIDVQTVSRWQGHRDNGALLLQVYAHVRNQHSDRMALMMGSEPPNVIPIAGASEQQASESA